MEFGKEPLDGHGHVSRTCTANGGEETLGDTWEGFDDIEGV